MTSVSTANAIHQEWSLGVSLATTSADVRTLIGMCRGGMTLPEDLACLEYLMVDVLEDVQFIVAEPT